MIQTYLSWVDVVGLGWSVTTEDELELPAAEGEGELAYASVPDGVDVFPTAGGPVAATTGAAAHRADHVLGSERVGELLSAVVHVTRRVPCRRERRHRGTS